MRSWGNHDCERILSSEYQQARCHCRYSVLATIARKHQRIHHFSDLAGSSHSSTNDTVLTDDPCCSRREPIFYNFRPRATTQWSQPPAPSCNLLHPPAPSYTLLHPPAPSCTLPKFLARGALTHLSRVAAAQANTWCSAKSFPVSKCCSRSRPWAWRQGRTANPRKPSSSSTAGCCREPDLTLRRATAAAFVAECPAQRVIKCSTRQAMLCLLSCNSVLSRHRRLLCRALAIPFLPT